MIFNISSKITPYITKSNKITPYITKISRSPKRTHHSQIDNSAQALQEFLVVSLWHKNFQVPLLCRFLRCYLVCYLSVIFRTWGKISRLDNAIDNAQKIHPVMALGKFSTMKSQPKTNVKPTTNCRFPSGACVYVTVTFLWYIVWFCTSGHLPTGVI